MKIDTEFHGETEHGDRCAVTATVIDPRLWIATQILVARIESGKVVTLAIDGEYEIEECQICMQWAEAMIAAHNAAAGDVVDGCKRIAEVEVDARAFRLLRKVLCEILADNLDGPEALSHAVRDALDEREARIADLLAALRALVPSEDLEAGWWCRQCVAETGATNDERCVNCGEPFGDPHEAEAIRAARAAIAKAEGGDHD